MTQKPKLGQNFLRDQKAIERIADSFGDLSQRTVVEIGAGAITSALAARAGRLVAVELDPRLAEYLRQEFAGRPVEIVNQDVLQFDLEPVAREADQPLLIAGNLPYGVTSPILTKLAANAHLIERAVLMIQREVADRVAAAPGSRDFGVLSIEVQMAGPVRKLFTLPPEAFQPPPEVYSTVFLWNFHPRWAELGVEPEAFSRFLRQVFAQKRKTLANNLRAAGYAADAIARASQAAEVSVSARAEALAIESLATLCRSLQG
jgi:16S rRNA (adenine1518-N6/adenine1519-N6)-dimethyltransferase